MTTDRRAVFVVGVGRSGTSLLQSMFAAHSEFAFPPETGFLRRYAGSATISTAARSSSRDAVVDLLNADGRLQRLGVSFSEIVDSAIDAGSLTDAAIYQGMLSAYATSLGKHHVGDKDPRLIEYLDLLHSVYPNADVVHIIRDPRDVLASKKKAQWSRRHSSLRHIFAYRVQFSMGQRQGRTTFGDRYHELSYEALIAAPGDELERLCRQMGIPFETGMLEFSKAAKTLVAPDEIGWKQETLGPLLGANSGKWRSTLTARETALVEFGCARAMRQNDYSTSNAWNSLTFADRIWVLAATVLMTVADPVYRMQRWLRNSRIGAEID